MDDITETQVTVEQQVICASKTYPGKTAEGLLCYKHCNSKNDFFSLCQLEFVTAKNCVRYKITSCAKGSSPTVLRRASSDHCEFEVNYEDTVGDSFTLKSSELAF